MNAEFHIDDLGFLKECLLAVSKEYEHVAILDSNSYSLDSYSEYEYIAGFGAQQIVKSSSLLELQGLIDQKKWLFGFLSYDLKNYVEELKSENSDALQFPDLCFFEPQILVRIKGDRCEITGEKAERFRELIRNVDVISRPAKSSSIEIVSKISKEKYIKQIIQILNHIQLGDIFELNFCQEFFAENAEIDPLDIYQKLKKCSPTPFGVYFRAENHYCMGASPERFMKKKGSNLLSQPIKGTVKRGIDENDDTYLKAQLLSNVKERAENVMIVDLVRNDFSKIAKKGSVQVDELFGIYTFPQVHQMISTVSCDAGNTSAVEIIRSCFPVGSMTGAPKVKAMELIEKYESTKRGLFSGAIGYISPEGDFDFNVVIRSVLYNKANKYLSFMVGGAITSGSQPQKEYEESLLKAKAIFSVFDQN